MRTQYRQELIKLIKTTPAFIVKEKLEIIKLPKQMYKIIILRFCERYTIKKIEKELNKSGSTITRRSKNALDLIYNSNIFNL